MTAIFNAAMISTVTAEDVSEYPMPFDESIIVRIKSASTARMRQYAESQSKGGSYARNQQYQLIKESVVDEHDAEVFATADDVRELSKGRARVFTALAAMVGDHNGSNDVVEQRENTEKNLSATGAEDSLSA